MLGTALARPGSLARRVLIALCVGYLVFCLTLPYHTATHDYYHLPLLIPISLAGALAVARGGEWIAELHASGPGYFIYDLRSSHGPH